MMYPLGLLVTFTIFYFLVRILLKISLVTDSKNIGAVLPLITYESMFAVVLS